LTTVEQQTRLRAYWRSAAARPDTHLTIARQTTVTSLARVALPWRTLLIGALLFAAAGVAMSRCVAIEFAPSTPAAPSAEPARAGLTSLPQAAQGAVSSALGAGNASYRIDSSGDNLRGSSPAQGFHERFSRSGATVSSGAVTLGVRLGAVGYAGSARAVPAVAPRASGNRVRYVHHGLSEWYANGPLGLEQGFTVSHAPPATAQGPLTLGIDLSGNARASLAPDDRSVRFSHGGSSLRYTGLLVTDATGRALHSWLGIESGRMLLRVDARGARYPLRIDPLVQAGDKLAPDDAKAPSEFGFSVALSADGNTALIGALIDDGELGAAWVFTRSGSTWTQQGPKLTPNDEVKEAQFGGSVALSADGNTALIGGNTDNADEGAAWVFTRSGSTWKQQGKKLFPNDHEGSARFGRSVALSADGNTALIGGYFDEGPKNKMGTGAAWVFTRSGNTWTQQGNKILGVIEEEGTGGFGSSVALSADGNTAAISGSEDNDNVGAIWIFTRAGASWSQQGPKLVASGESGQGRVGESVAMSSDGNTLLAGAPADNKEAGAAWVFTRSGSTWTQQGGKLTGGEGATPLADFGFSVDLSADGNTALIGAPVDGKKALTGAAWEFQRSGSVWSHVGPKLTDGPGETEEGAFGEGVALSASGETALIGVPGENGVGAAVPFVATPPGVVTDAATNLNTSTATLNGTVDAGAASTVHFQYGATTGYGAVTPGQSLSASDSAQPISAAVTGLSPGATYHFRIVAENLGGVSVGADQTFTTPVAPVRPTAPVISAVSQTHRSWREGNRRATFARRRPPIGTTFSLALNERASVRLAFTQRVGGRRVNGRCVAQTRRNRHKRACKRTVTIAAIDFSGHAGRNRVAFQGKISQSRKLKPGVYTLVITAVNTARQHSNTESLSFVIVK
jgi:FG-GAP repeat